MTRRPDDRPAGSDRRRLLPARTAMISALLDGLTDDDRAWVIDRIEHYRRLAAAQQVPEGRI